MKTKNIIKYLLIVLSTILYMNNIKAYSGDAGGISNDYSGGTQGSGSADSDWGFAKTISGIRVTIVDEYGNMIEGTRSVDYLTGNYLPRFIYVCSNEKKHKLAYRDEKSGCTWTKVDRSKGNNVHLLSNINFSTSWLPKLYGSASQNPVQKIKDFILNLSETELNEIFFNESKINYNIDENRKYLINHYFIIEPLTGIRVSSNGSGKSMEYGMNYYYGTTTELSDFIIDGAINKPKSYHILIFLFQFMFLETLTYKAMVATTMKMALIFTEK